MEYPWLIPLLAALATIVLVLVVNRTGPRTEVRSVFTFVALMLVLWNLNFFVLYFVTDHDLAWELARIVRLGGLFAPPIALHLFVVVRNKPSRLWSITLAIDYAFTSLIVALNAFDLLVSDIKPIEWGYSSVGTSLYHLLTVSAVVNFLGAAGLLVYDYRTTDEPRHRLQVKFWLLGALVQLPLALTNFLPAYGVPFYPLGNLGTVFWAGITAYAIFRHRLMDIDLVLTKGAAYLAGGALLIIPGFVLVILMQKRAFGSVHYDFSFAVLVLLILTGVLFPTLRFRTEATIEKSFFREKHAYRRALSNFTKSIIQILDRDKLIRELTNTLADTLQLDRVAVYARDLPQDPLTVKYHFGAPVPADELDGHHPLINLLLNRGEPILQAEVDDLRSSSDMRLVANLFDSGGWEVCVPLIISGGLIGFITLGRKRNLDAFSVVDLELLSTLGAQASIALENARLYQELHRSRDIIQRAGRMSALGTLAAGIAHEIRNPLVSIQTFFQLAPNRLHDEEFLTSFLSLAEKEVKRIGDLVNELLTFARSSSESAREVDIDDTVDRTLKLLSPQATKTGIRLEYISKDKVSPVPADADRIKQVLINIVLNAIQATPPGGIVSVSLREVYDNARRFCQIEVKDTGPGIPADLQEDIFNPFFTTKDKGTGLGLSIAHQIISEHGGYISVQSEDGRGSRFLINLPSATRHTEVAA